MFVTASTDKNSDCEACADMANCAEQLQASSAQRQIVPLKNGVMFVYTADTPSHVRSVQTAMARRTDRLVELASAGDRAKLCPDCKTMRGALASGKVTRETVNIEGGCLMLMTSTDPALVAKLHALAGMQTSSRNKS